MKHQHLAAATLAAVCLPLSATADRYDNPGRGHQPVRIMGQYFLSDDHIDLSGGAVLYSDCTHDGSVVAAIPAGPNRIVAKMTATYWVNDPDPTVAPYDLWEVPEALEDVPRLFLCYDVEQISGPSLSYTEFCDWAPRDMKEPLAVDFEGDGIRDMLIGVNYHGGPNQCSDR